MANGQNPNPPGGGGGGQGGGGGHGRGRGGGGGGQQQQPQEEVLKVESAGGLPELRPNPDTGELKLVWAVKVTRGRGNQPWSFKPAINEQLSLLIDGRREDAGRTDAVFGRYLFNFALTDEHKKLLKVSVEVVADRNGASASAEVPLPQPAPEKDKPKKASPKAPSKLVVKIASKTAPAAAGCPTIFALDFQLTNADKKGVKGVVHVLGSGNVNPNPVLLDTKGHGTTTVQTTKRVELDFSVDGAEVEKEKLYLEPLVAPEPPAQWTSGKNWWSSTKDFLKSFFGGE